MVYSRLFWNILIRTILLTANAIVLGLLIVFLDGENFVTITLVGALLIVQVVFFVIALNRINRDLSTFFDSLYSLDSSISFKDSMASRQFKGLYEKLIRVNSIIGSLKINLEEQYEYFKRIANQMPIPIISYFDTGEIGLINEAGRKMFANTRVSNIKDIKDVSSELANLLLADKKLGQEVIRTNLNNETVTLIVKISSTRYRERTARIASIQNIESELEQKEIESWQRLLKVLTHEIANSIAPISSTVDTLNDLVEISNENGLEKIKTGLGIIGERSDELLSLLSDIRRFSSFPEPDFKKLEINDLLISTAGLMKEETSRSGIELVVEKVPGDLIFCADKQLVTSVIINLITNSIEALSEADDKKIILKADKDGGGFYNIRCIDNGPGISEEMLDQIMVPFYTTKKTGSGIGLSLSREIMRQHGGTLSLTSKPGRTEFTMRFPNQH